jgi:hypothetical protein
MPKADDAEELARSIRADDFRGKLCASYLGLGEGFGHPGHLQSAP